ncbi:MAG: hypothetical protein IKB30_04945 [Clostridia bacterium]|nr:hypothetical protein [Clostridia bacterium]
MSLFSAGVKTACEKINQKLYQRDLRNAQPKAYKETCQKTRGRYDKDWHNKYHKALNSNIQKAQDKKELRSTFINNL